MIRYTHKKYIIVKPVHTTFHSESKIEKNFKNLVGALLTVPHRVNTIDYDDMTIRIINILNIIS